MIPAFIFAVAFALLCAVDDYGEIRDAKDINHGLQWCIRAGGVVSLLVLWLIVGESQWPHVALTGLAMAPLFSGVFRIALNKLRGLDWRYVSPSNWYDWQFIRHTLGWINKRNYRNRVNEVHAIGMHDAGTPDYPIRIYRAGLLAYAFELLMFVGLTYLSLRVK